MAPESFRKQGTETMAEECNGVNYGLKKLLRMYSLKSRIIHHRLTNNEKHAFEWKGVEHETKLARTY